MKSKHLILLVIAIMMVAMPSAADNRKRGEKQVAQNALPVPDALPKALKPEKPVKAPKEVTIRIVVHRQVASSRYGIDVSHYQGSINWDKVAKDDRVQYVYLKATESYGYVDNTYRYNLSECRRVGIPVGVYHFFSPTASALSQYENFVANVDLREQDLIPIVDVETRGKGSLSEFQGRLKDFLDALEEHYGVQPIIYTGVNFYNKYLNNGNFRKYKYMIARYAEEPPSTDLTFVMWQFSANGRIDGISGPVDRSCFMDNYKLNDILLKRKKK